MRGGWIHNHLYARMLWESFQCRGWAVSLEHPVDGRGRCVDLLAVLGTHRLVVEVELTPARVRGDLAKSGELGAGHLWIVVPDRRVGAAVARRLGRCPEPPQDLHVRVLTFPRALRAAKEFSAWISPTIPT